MPPLERTLPLLDLHGLRKEEAIQAVTRFLETHESRHHYVQIITGTGSHSPHGPVLRTAVDNLLRRRQMEFEQDKPGSFRVRSGTGIVFYHQAACDVDTKVIVQHRPSTTSQEEFNLQTALARSKGTRSEHNILLQHHQQPLVSLSSGPTLAEVAQNDAEFALARQESLALQRQDNRHKSREKNEMDLALEISLKQMDLEKAEEEHALQKSIQEAMATSEAEALRIRQEEEQDLQQALEQSAKELAHSLHELNEEELLREAMEQSLREATDRSADDEEDRILQEVLQMSLQS